MIGTEERLAARLDQMNREISGLGRAQQGIAPSPEASRSRKSAPPRTASRRLPVAVIGACEAIRAIVRIPDSSPGRAAHGPAIGAF